MCVKHFVDNLPVLINHLHHLQIFLLYCEQLAFTKLLNLLHLFNIHVQKLGNDSICFPFFPQGIYRFSNSQLAQYVLNQQAGAAVEIKFELVKDPDSESGYLWTSVVGRHRPVTPGSFCSGYVVIERKPPIEKVFYKISQWLRSR